MMQQAESNRDRKRQRKPFQLSDFCIYGPTEENKAPAARYGSAADALIQKGIFPSWALFVYSDLKKNAKNATPPEPLAFVSENAVILAPNCGEGLCNGMLIATKSASGQVIEFKLSKDITIKVLMPAFQASVYAEEDISMPIVR